MSSIGDRQAFPVSDGLETGFDGMTYRQYLIGQALSRTGDKYAMDHPSDTRDHIIAIDAIGSVDAALAILDAENEKEASE